MKLTLVTTLSLAEIISAASVRPAIGDAVALQRFQKDGKNWVTETSSNRHHSTSSIGEDIPEYRVGTSLALQRSRDGGRNWIEENEADSTTAIGNIKEEELNEIGTSVASERT